ncbi:FAD-binding oxidoreductase [Nocardia goodfellowii]
MNVGANDVKPTVTGQSRRRMLLGAGGLAVAGVTGALFPGTAGATVGSAEWGKLSSLLRGKLVLPEDREYHAAKALFDPRFDGNMPLGVVQAATPEDVQAAMVFAREHGLPVAARAGGHSFVGASATSGALIIDVRRLDRITAHGDQVTVGAGTTIAAVQDALAPLGSTLPLGMCRTVGVAGLTLGGGVGVEVRGYGLTCDRLVSAEVVLPSGGVKRATATTAPELFWALRGAGGGTGIVTSLTYHTCPAMPKDIARLSFPVDRAARVLDGWAQWMPTADRGVYARFEVAAADDLRCEVLVVSPGGGGAKAVAGLLDAAATRPSAEDRRTLLYLDAMRELDREKPKPRTTRIAGSDVVAEITPAAAELIVDVILDRARSGAVGRVLIEPLDGAVGEIATGETAFPWRDHAACLEWIVNTPDPPEEAHRWILSANRAVSAISAGAFFNHVQPTDTGRRCFAGNLPRLEHIRQTLDPDRRLRWGIKD